MILVASCTFYFQHQHHMKLHENFILNNSSILLPVKEINVGDIVYVNVTGMVKYKDEIGHILISFKDNDGSQKQMMIHVENVIVKTNEKNISRY